MKLLDQIQKVDEEISARLVLQQEDSFTHKLAALIGHSCDSWYWLIGLTLVWVFHTPDPFVLPRFCGLLR